MKAGVHTLKDKRRAKVKISYTGCIKKKVIELQRAIIRELLGV
jgi:hypothetical protein